MVDVSELMNRNTSYRTMMSYGTYVRPSQAPELNVKAIRETLEKVEQEAEKDSGLWDQGHWVVVGGEAEPVNVIDNEGDEYFVVMNHCGTTGCFAGHGVLMNGYLPMRQSSLVFNPTTMGVSHVQEAAVDLFGLTVDEADALFNGENRIEDLRTIAETICGEAL